MKQCTDSESLHRRLKKIIGQVQVTDRMADENVPREDVLAQINAAESVLYKVSRVVLKDHTKHYVRDGVERGDMDQTTASFAKAVECSASMVQARTGDMTHV